MIQFDLGKEFIVEQMKNTDRLYYRGMFWYRIRSRTVVQRIHNPDHAYVHDTFSTFVALTETRSTRRYFSIPPEKHLFFSRVTERGPVREGLARAAHDLLIDPTAKPPF